MSPPPPTRRCPVCEETLPAAAFGWRDRAHTRPQSYCRDCMRGAWRDWYADVDNRARHIAAVRSRRQARIARLRRIVRDRKAVPCADCRRRFPPEAMDFDHVRGEKFGDISQLVYVAGEQRLLHELEKCEVVCAICHRLRTRRRQEDDAPPATG